MDILSISTAELEVRFDQLKTELTRRYQEKTREDEETLNLVLSRNLAMHGFTEGQILSIHCEINNVCRACLDGPSDCPCERDE